MSAPAAFVVSFFANYAATSCREEVFSLPDLVRIITTATASEKTQLPWLKLGRFGTTRSDKNSLRHDANVRAITGVEVDYDGETIGFDGAVEIAGKAGLAGIIYTSPSQHPDKPRWRIIAPTSRELPPGERARLVARLNGLYGGVFAGESFALSQSYFYGSVDNNPHHRVVQVNGQAIDELDELDNIAFGKSNGAGGAHHAGKRSTDKSRSATAFRKGAALRRAAKTYDEMVEALRADPETAGWCREKGTERQFKRIWDKAPSNTPDRAVIEVVGGLLPMLVDQAERYLIEHDPELFQRGDFIVRPAKVGVTISNERTAPALRLVPVRAQHLVERLGRIVDFQRYNARSKKLVSVDCPSQIAAAYLERVGAWKLPLLLGVTNAPTLRPDGSILDMPGYDDATGILYDPAGAIYPPVPTAPTLEDARRALEMLKGLISEFPFVDDASRSVALSGILTAIIRRSLPCAPAHAFDAPEAGTGKSKLVDLASMIATGHEAPVIAQGKTADEMEKRIGASLIAGDTIISIDNCEAPLGGELLCQAITQTMLNIRVLGQSLNVNIPNTAAFFATGNNLQVVGDMIRRSIVCALDPKTERPETRTFKNEDPIEIVRRNRPRYVIAALTVLRAYIAAGQPCRSLIPLGSFEAWSNRVRDALIWLGEADPCSTMERARADDPERRALAAVIAEWTHVIGASYVTVKRLIEYAVETEIYQQREAGSLTFKHPDFREALLVVAGDRGNINSLRLGKWLGKVKGRVVNGHRIEQASTMGHGGTIQWRAASVPS